MVNSLENNFNDFQLQFNKIKESILKDFIENLNYDKFTDYNQELIQPLQNSIESILSNIRGMQDLVNQSPNLNPVVSIISAFLFKLSTKFDVIYQSAVDDMTSFNNYLNVFKNHSDSISKDFDDFNKLIKNGSNNVIASAVQFFENYAYFNNLNNTNSFINEMTELNSDHQIKLLNCIEIFFTRF
jgi:hypothetical protein